MFGLEEIARLRSHKERLLLQSDQNRRALADRTAGLRSALWWVAAAKDLVREAKPLLLAVAPGIGLWLGRKISARPQFLTKLVSGLRLAREVRRALTQ